MVTVRDISITSAGNTCGISALIDFGDHNREPETLWFSIPAELAPDQTSADPFAAAFLAPCMAAGIDLFIDAPLSPVLKKAIPKIQGILTGWYPELSRIEVRHAGITEQPGITRKVRTAGIFFSGGVDSTFSALTLERTPDYGIYVHGFENPVNRLDLLETARKILVPIAGYFNLKIIEVHTNLRSMADQNLSPIKKKYTGNFFGECYLGSMLAASGLCLQDHFSHIFIPASLSDDDLKPYGSHPEIDPLWSTDKTEFIHHGIDHTRFRKIKMIAETAPELLSHLQVCERNTAGETNCCRCEKCIRTMMALDIIGSGDKASSFHLPFNPYRMIGKSNRKRRESEYRELLREASAVRSTENQKILEAILGENITKARVRDIFLRTLKSILRWFFPRLQRMLLGKRAKNWKGSGKRL